MRFLWYKFNRIYDWNGMEEANFKLENKESQNEKLTKIPTDGTSEEFLRYLDSNFKSEINLLDDGFELFKFSKSSEALKSADLGIEEVNLTYRGHKHMFTKGLNAERRDVLYKSFIRATRRYLWTMFENEFDISLMPVNKPSDVYRKNVRSLYEKFFRSFASNQITSSEETEEEICFIIATILSNKYSFPYKTDRHRRFISQFENVNHKFSKSTYERFLSINEISNVFEMFLKSGMVDKMIEAYPKLSESRDSYLRTAKSIVEFKETKTLMK